MKGCVKCKQKLIKASQECSEHRLNRPVGFCCCGGGWRCLLSACLSSLFLLYGKLWIRYYSLTAL